jgi:NAD(P)H dehydrogenase (quinone)
MRIAVTGANGRLGGEVVNLLAADGAHDIVAVSRRPIATSRYGKRVRAATADYADRAALRAALRGVDTLVFVSSEGEATKVLVHHQNVIEAAADSDINHIVALSGLDADLESPFCYAITYALTEQLLFESGCSISVARSSIYTEFFLAWLNQARSSRQLRLPAADGRVSFVSRSDVARALVALATAHPTGQAHDITGPEALDLPTLAAIAKQEWETPIEYIDLAPGEHREEMARAGEEAWWLYAYSSMFDSIRDQRWAAVSDEVHRLAGHAATSVRTVLSHQLNFTP